LKEVNMKRLLAFVLLASSVGASAATIEAAGGDWSDLPLLKRKGLQQISAESITRIHEAVAQSGCDLPGQSRRRLNMTVPFVVQFSPDGTPSRVVIQRLNCAAVERVIGGAVLRLVETGEYQPTGENDYGWYRSEISFTSRI
jgi:hypothetical protein